MEGNNVFLFECRYCLPKIKVLRVNKGTKHNLKSHFKRIHPSSAKQVDDACKANFSSRARSRNMSLTALTAVTGSGSSDIGTCSASAKRCPRQMSLGETIENVAQGSHVLQANVDKAVVALVVDNMSPLLTASTEAEGTDTVELLSPWPFLDKWIHYKKMEGNDVFLFECRYCLPKIKVLRVNKGTKHNLKSHFKRIHPSSAKQVDDACKANFSSRARSGNMSLAALTAVTGSGSSDIGTRSASVKRCPCQMSLAETIENVAQGSDVLQANVDKAIVAFVLENMLPLQLVDSKSFRSLVRILNPKKEVPSRRTLESSFIDMYEEMKDDLIK